MLPAFGADQANHVAPGNLQMMIVAQTIELFEMHTTHETFSSKRPETNGVGIDQKVEAVSGASTVVHPYNQFMQNKSSRDTRIA
jgi:hypothetical protein